MAIVSGKSKNKQYFETVDTQASFSSKEDEVTKYWQKNKTFEKSIENRPEDKRWTFLDGPPFITGLPHYGSLLSSIPKDVYPRFWTMKGYRVRRVWGWDCHGLPVENKVENKLKLKSKRDIEEKVGIDKFIKECKLYVSESSKEWNWYIDKIARWVDFEHAYRTMDQDYMESVMWVFSEMYKKGHIYKGRRVSLYCPHCVTPISNFEVAMDPDNYKEVTEAANTYKYQLAGEDDTYLLAWSTTPWNKLATPALAVNPHIQYVKVQQKDEKYILAKSRLDMLNGKYKIIDKFPGKKLVGLKFEPHYNFYKIQSGKKAFVVIGGDFVSDEEGTGIVTIAAYGEDDMRVMEENNIQIVLHVDEEGKLKKNVPNGWAGMDILEINPLVNKDLTERGLMYDEHEHTHTVPTCWRCHTRLMYAPQDAWFVNIANLKPRLFENNEDINWVPGHFKDGRFKKSMEAAPDWCISRNRYWGSPVPVWETEDGERIVPSSIAELEELSGQKVKSLHKPDIDEITITLEDGRVAKRVPEVLDSWIEAGSASFAERHFPFNNKIKLEDFFPPDFIVEYTGQIRAWFYVLHVIGTALFDSAAFKNVVVTGVILGTDGRKMSKNFGNYPDPKTLLEKYGGDALRLYLMGSPVMKGEDILISEEEYREQLRGFLIPLKNVYNFFVTYANVDEWKTPKNLSSKNPPAGGTDNVLDKWIISRLHSIIKQATSNLEDYDSPNYINILTDFLVNDLSGWYVRRIRDRVGPTAQSRTDANNTYKTLYYVLTNFTQISAPIVPFMSEQIYKNLTKEESVHLTDWPVSDGRRINKNLEKEMDLARKIVEMGHSARAEKQIRVRQPLSEITIEAPIKLDRDIKNIIASELNVLKVSSSEGDDIKANLNTEITQDLKAMGDARDIIRKIQVERKKLETNLTEKVNVSLPQWPEDYESEIKSKALINNLAKGSFKVSRVK